MGLMGVRGVRGGMEVMGEDEVSLDQVRLSEVKGNSWTWKHYKSSAVKRLIYLIAINRINVIVNSRLIAHFFYAKYPLISVSH